MKVACAEALAELARQDVPDAVVKAYGDEPIQYGPNYIIPKPVDPRVLFPRRTGDRRGRDGVRCRAHRD